MAGTYTCVFEDRFFVEDEGVSRCFILGALARQDVLKLVKDRSLVDTANQLHRGVGSIGANIAEGYSRSSKMDQARFYEYALGSGRESYHWYLLCILPFTQSLIEIEAT